MLDKQHSLLSTRKQCDLLGIARATVYYKERSATDETELVNEIHEIWIRKAYYGYRRITMELKRRNFAVNHKRVLRLMREAKIQALYPRPKTSSPNLQHKRYPYLLKNVVVERPNQVWATDITYIKFADGWMYLLAIIDIYSRYVVAWSLSNTMDADFCIELLKRALSQATPEILNTDQGSQFTSDDWITCVEQHGVKVSMDGVGRWVDNVYIERFWRTVKHDFLFWHVFDSVKELKTALKNFICEYNMERLHQSLRYNTPHEVYSQKVYIPPMHYKKARTEIHNNDIAEVAPQFPPRGDTLASARKHEQSPREAHTCQRLEVA